MTKHKLLRKFETYVSKYLDTGPPGKYGQEEREKIVSLRKPWFWQWNVAFQKNVVKLKIKLLCIYGKRIPEFSR